MTRTYGNLVVRTVRFGLLVIPSTNPKELAKIMSLMHSCAPQAQITAFTRHGQPINVQVNELEPTEYSTEDFYDQRVK